MYNNNNQNKNRTKKREEKIWLSNHNYDDNSENYIQ